MIKILKEGSLLNSQYELEAEFTLFGGKPVKDYVTFKTQDRAKAYYHELKMAVFLDNFGLFIIGIKRIGNLSEKQALATGRLIAATNYFVDTEDLALQKMCDMTLKVQKHLIDALPSSKTPMYQEYFDRVNQLIKFCKEEIK